MLAGGRAWERESEMLTAGEMGSAATFRSLLVLLLVFTPLLANSLEESENEVWRQSGGSWLCANWIPVVLQNNICRVYCIMFMNRLPSGNDTNYCVDGRCDCSQS